MNLAAIEHRAFDNYCYPVDGETLEINLRTGKDVERVFLLWGDPFDWGKSGDASNYNWRCSSTELTGKKELQNHLWWTVRVRPPVRRAKYFFRICGDGGTWIYGESGLCPEEEFRGREDSYYAFIFPWMNRSDISAPPSWAENTIWYQIFPSRFRRGPMEGEQAGILDWASANTKVTNKQKFGGNLNGITEKLAYLADLGVTGIYLNPVNCSTTEHKYDTTDYYTIDPELGTGEDMKRLVHEAHKLGILVMLDGVFNHSGWEFFAWQDLLKNREKSKYASWYMVNDWKFVGRPADNAEKGRFFSFAYCDYMPKFNTNDPGLRKYLVDVCEFWVREYDIDALRLDVANEVCHSFCRELQDRMRLLKEDFYIIGEIWHNAMPWLRGNEFDAIMNYPLQNAIYKFALGKDEDSCSFEQDVNRCLTDYPSQTRRVMFNLMDSHDTERLVTKLGNSDRAVQALALMFAMPGSPCLYYGTEAFLEGGKDPDCRRCMPWDDIEGGNCADSLALVKALVKLRKEEGALRGEGLEFEHQAGSPRLLVLRKMAEGAGDILDAGAPGAGTVASGSGNGLACGGIRLFANFGGGDVDIASLTGGGELLFANRLEGGMLRADGVAVFRA
ncbi:MAG: glycoside hydrolase family 13 protein [Treponema sp.]|nr:glycoside hydrolase family 13 protein [Treponema sp.]